MTHTQAQSIINEAEKFFVRFGNEISDTQADIWKKGLLPLNLSKAKEALREFFISNPAYIDKYKGTMPPFADFKSVYLDVTTPKTDYCPCCVGMGWIRFDQLNGVVRCDCSPAEIDLGEFKVQNKTLGEVFPNNPHAKCDSFQCSPRGNSPCPLGSQHYNTKKVAFMDRTKQNPDYQLGLTFLKPDGRLAESMADMVGDVVEEEDPLPF